MTTETETVKVCRKCGEPKPTTEFYRESRGAHKPEGKFRAICKDCWLGKEPPVEFSELKDFAKRFILGHLAANGETVDEFFRHRLPYNYREVTREVVERAINELLKAAKVKVTRRESAGKYGSIAFLALA